MEFAFVAPVFLMLVFVALEFVRANNILHTAEQAAYEAARRGIVPGATVAQVREACDFVLGSVGARGAVVTVTPGTITPSTRTVTVDIRVPMNANGFVTPLFFRDRVVQASMRMVREEFSQSSTP